MKPLISNKHYSNQALAYPKDVDRIVSVNSLNIFIGLPLLKKIQSGDTFEINFLVGESKSSGNKNEFIIYWKFKTERYDIKFGVYKLNSLRDTHPSQLEDTKRGKDFSAVIPLQKVSSIGEFSTGTIIVRDPGYYRVIFDNTYSYFREKELTYSVNLLCRDAKYAL